MKKLSFRDPAVLIGAAGLLALCAVFLRWIILDGNGTVLGHTAAVISAGLFAAVCLRFIRPWLRFWNRNTKLRRVKAEKDPVFIYPLIFVVVLLVDILVLLLIYALRVRNGFTAPLKYQLDFMRCLDSGHYLDISRDWYLSEGREERLVQLVFLPGYPIIVHIFTWFTHSDVIAGLVVSGLCFGGAGCMVYRLLRLDMPMEDALRTLKYLVICPGTFFFAAPMSEGLFLLLCCACLYLVRKKRWLLGCLCGAYAAFTRSLGLTLVVPVFFEAIHVYARTEDKKRLLQHFLGMIIILCGFGAYLYINYAVAGDPFKFLEYQANHWRQHLGWFFATADAQTEYAVNAFTEKPGNFIGMWMPNIIAAFFSLAVMVYGAKRMRPSYTAWFIVYYPIAMGATWLLSGPRYMLVLLPVTIAVGKLTKKKALDAAMTIAYICAGAVYLYAFVMRWQVW